MRFQLTVAAFLLLTGGSTACYEPSNTQLVDGASAGQTAPQQAASPAQLAYLVDDEVTEAFDFEGGTLGVPLTITRGSSFTGVSVTLTSPVAEIYYRTNPHDIWLRLHASEKSGEMFHAGYISTERPTRQLQFWSPYPLAFGRLEFHEVATGQALPLDDEPGYADETDEVAPDVDYLSEEEDGVRRQMLAKPGPWALSADARAAGQQQYVSYDSPPAWNGGRNCTGGLQPGARELGEFLVRNFEGARSFGGYNCRRIVGGSGMSVHGVGRAIDLFVPLDGGAADNDLGDEIAHYLVKNAQVLGVQFIIWDRTKWNASYSGSKDRYYGGQHPHHDHLHIELTEEAARRSGLSFPGASPEPPPLVFDAPFADDDTNAHLAAIEAIYEAGITRGCGQSPLRYCPEQEVSRANAAVMLQRTLKLNSVSGDFFDDDEGLGAEAAINVLAARDIVTGCNAGDRQFCPEAALTRGQLAVMLDRGLQLADTREDYFTDDDGTFYEAAANRVAAAGITKGCAERSFCGGATVRRDEMASFLARAAGLLPGFSAQPIAYRGHFADDDGHLFEDAIDAIASQGIVNGCVQGETPLYCPDDAATRSQVATVIVRAFSIPASNVDAFSDDDGNVHEAAINAIAAANITSGCAEGKFCPERDISRGEVAVFLQRTLRLPATSTDYFDDDEGAFYEDAANRLAAAGFTNGCREGEFCGARPVTRGEVAAFLSRALGL